MKRPFLNALAISVAGLLLCVNVQTQAQSLGSSTVEWDRATPGLPSGFDAPAPTDVQLVSAASCCPEPCSQCSRPGCDGCCPLSYVGCCEPGFFAGADFLLIRPHFSEAIAFAHGTQTPTAYQVVGRELEFDYGPSLRVFAGYRAGNGCGEIRFTYSHFRGDVDVSADGPPLGSGQFFVDPFGNIVGAAAIMDPSDARYIAPPEDPEVLFGGDRIETRATVDMNVYDIDFVRPVLLRTSGWALSWSVGARVADVKQYYESVITDDVGDLFSRGDFAVDFLGAGPRLGFEARHHCGQACRFSVFAKGYGALLVGEYDVRSSNQVTDPFDFVASQQSSLTRTLPVMETELGISWCTTDSLTVSLGWLFHAWFDLGTSGGKFGGFFAGADDANIMSFDGLFLTADRTF